VNKIYNLLVNLVKDLLTIFCCPDDRADLIYEDNYFVCQSCKKGYKIDGKIIDFRPANKLKLKDSNVIEKDYKSYYQSLNGKSESNKKSFGIITGSISPGLVKEIILYIKKKIHSSSIVCDVGAGTGDYSVKLAEFCKFLFHCDLDFNGIKIALQNSNKRDLDNVFFILSDYFFLPFKDEVFNVVYSIDVVERGLEHDQLLLKQISRITRHDGYCLFDCHAKERAKLTHTIPKTIKQYSKEEIIQLAKSCSLEPLEIKGAGYLPQVKTWSSSTYNILNPMAKLTRIPSARWLLINKPKVQNRL